jgi:hypothetical protein
MAVPPPDSLAMPGFFDPAIGDSHDSKWSGTGIIAYFKGI